MVRTCHDAEVGGADVSSVLDGPGEDGAVADTLLDVQPTTIAGVVALLDYAHCHEQQHMEGWPDDYFVDLSRHAADSLATIASRRVAGA